MPDNINPTPEATPPVTPEATPPAPEEVAGGLPSEQPDETLIGGKFKTVEDALQHIKDMEDKYANARRELAEKEKGGTPEGTPPADPAANEVALKQQEVIDKDLIPAFMNNGMVITPEMEAKAQEVGIDPRDLKIGAYELKEKLTTSYAITGSRENYEAMIAWGKTNLSPAQQEAFESDFYGSMSDFAVEGLWNRYQKAGGEGANNGNDDRLRGNNGGGGIKPYADRKELFKDKDYIESAAGRRDQAAIKRYRDRLRITPNEVLGI